MALPGRQPWPAVGSCLQGVAPRGQHYDSVRSDVRACHRNLQTIALRIVSRACLSHPSIDFRYHAEHEDDLRAVELMVGAYTMLAHATDSAADAERFALVAAHNATGVAWPLMVQMAEARIDLKRRSAAEEIQSNPGSAKGKKGKDGQGDAKPLKPKVAPEPTKIDVPSTAAKWAHFNTLLISEALQRDTGEVSILLDPVAFAQLCSSLANTLQVLGRFDMAISVLMLSKSVLECEHDASHQIGVIMLQMQDWFTTAFPGEALSPHLFSSDGSEVIRSVRGASAATITEHGDAIISSLLPKGPGETQGTPTAWDALVTEAEILLERCDLAGARSILVEAHAAALVRGDTRVVARVHLVLTRLANIAEAPLQARDFLSKAVQTVETPRFVTRGRPADPYLGLGTWCSDVEPARNPIPSCCRFAGFGSTASVRMMLPRTMEDLFTFCRSLMHRFVQPPFVLLHILPVSFLGAYI
jgi:hypothetical protein